MLGLSKGSETDVIKSSTLNLTKVSTVVAGVLAALTAGSGLAEHLSALPDELTGFAGGQRVLIIVALITGAAVVQAADLLARGIASSRGGGAAVICLPKAIPARMRTDHNDTEGTVAALRSDGHVLFCGEQNSRPMWAPEDSVRYK